jgi:hypothetical protein
VWLEDSVSPALSRGHTILKSRALHARSRDLRRVTKVWICTIEFNVRSPLTSQLHALTSHELTWREDSVSLVEYWSPTCGCRPSISACKAATFSHLGWPIHGMCISSWMVIGMTSCDISVRRITGKLRLKCNGTRAETRFRLSAKRTSPFKSAGGVSSVD